MNLPTTWCSAEINDDLGSTEEVILLVELDELEGSSGSVAVLLGHMIILIKTSLRVFLCSTSHVV